MDKDKFVVYNMHLLIYLAYHATELTHKTGVLVRITRIIDSSNFPLRQTHRLLQLYSDVFKKEKDHFIEYTNSIVVFKPPFFVKKCYSLVSKFLSQRTMDKLKVVDSLVGIPKHAQIPLTNSS